MAILAQSSADFALRYNFQGPHILGTSRGHLALRSRDFFVHFCKSHVSAVQGHPRFLCQSKAFLKCIYVCSRCTRSPMLGSI